MRYSRKLLLSQDGGIVHKFWQAHDKKFLLSELAVKKTYLKHTFFTLSHKSVQESVRIHAYCVMSNHSHQLVSYKGRSQNLSNFMRIAHSRFGQEFNKENKRLGAVACGRPKTPLVQPDSWHMMRVHFYIEANPLRARIVKNLKLYHASSHRFYAWGIKDEFSDSLEIPDWYLKLGKTPKERQSKYRSLFYKFLKETDLRSSFLKSFTRQTFLGDEIWVFEKKETLKCGLSPPQ